MRIGLNYRLSRLVIVVALLLVASVPQAFANDEVEIIELSLEDAIRTAIANSSDVETARLNARLAEISLMETKSQGLDQISPVALASAEENYAKAVQNITDTMRSVALSVEDRYYSLLNSYDQVAAARRSSESSKRQLDAVEVRFEAGMESQSSLDAARNSVADAERSLANALFSLTTEEMRFNAALGLELDTIVNLADDFGFEPVDVGLDESIESALLNRSDVENRRKALEDATVSVELADNPWTAPIELEKAEISLRKAEMALEDTLRDVVIAVRGAYASFMSSQDNVVVRQVALAKAEADLEKVRVRYEAGLSTLNDMNSAEGAVANSTSQLAQAIFSFNKAKASFYQAIGHDYVPIEDLLEELDGGGN